jgi:hypothetical protein
MGFIRGSSTSFKAAILPGFGSPKKTALSHSGKSPHEEDPDAGFRPQIQYSKRYAKHKAGKSGLNCMISTNRRTVLVQPSPAKERRLRVCS